MKYLEKILKTLGNRRRLAILALLKKKEASVGEIASSIKLSLTATSRHLGILRAVDLVEREQRSLEAYYSLSRSQTKVVRHILSEL